jgi:hypothetical protein
MDKAGKLTSSILRWLPAAPKNGAQRVIQSSVELTATSKCWWRTGIRTLDPLIKGQLNGSPSCGQQDNKAAKGGFQGLRGGAANQPAKKRQNSAGHMS